MKKSIFTLGAFLIFGFSTKIQAQCSGASVAITNFNVFPSTGQVIYGFDWEFVQGNASLQVQFYCDNTFIESLVCIPRLKDETAGKHHVGGVYVPPIACSGVFSVRLVTWTNNNCGGDSCQIRREVPGNIILPVSLKQFTANRQNSMVSLKWETATEQNNAGFAIERSTGGNWQEVGFVASKAQGGNSSDVLQYQYSDLNNVKAVSQYRIRQVDLDGKAKYSEIRSVRGEGQAIKTIVYPNPSVDGKVNVVFEDAGGPSTKRDLSVVDMNGRIVKQMKGISNNNVTIDNLLPGIYSLRIFIPATGEQSVEKIVVNRR